jgi:hypothetical protein
MRSVAITEQTAAALTSVQGDAGNSSPRAEMPYEMCIPRRSEHTKTALLRIAALLCCAAVAVAVWSASASAAVAVVHPYVSSFGSFANVQGVATDAAGDVYVFDAGTATIDKFGAAGNPVNFAATGTNEITGVGGAGDSENEIAVDSSTGSTAGDIYVANGSPSAVQIFSSAGSPIGTLSPEAGIPWSGEACGVAVDPSGNVYIGTFAGQILKYVPTANPVTNANYSSSIGGAESPCNIAVDQAGNVFSEKWREGPITRYEPSQFGSSAATGSIVDSKGSTLAVDPTTQELYVDEGSQVEQFGPHGEPFEGPVSTFAGTGEGAISNSFGIAVGPVNHDVYVSDGNGKLSIFGTVASGHVPTVTTGAASELTPGAATLNGTVNPEEAPIGECFFEYGESRAYGKTVPCAESPAEIGSGNAPVAVHANVSGLVGLTSDEYHFRLVAAQTVKGFGEDSSFIALLPPAIEDTHATNVSSTSATLQGTLNPRAHDTTYHFEYGTDTNYGSSTPTLDAGSSAAGAPVAPAHVQGLSDDTTYHYRLVAGSVIGTTDGPDATFTTESVGGPLTLLDGRQWELVSPPEKHGAGIIPERFEGAVIQAADDGSGLVYLSQNPIESKPEGNRAPEPTQILARRLPGGGWANRTMTTPNDDIHGLPLGEGTEYKLFSPNLSEAIVAPTTTEALAPGVMQRTPYLRTESACAEGKPNCYTPLVTTEDTAPGAVWDPTPENRPGVQFIDASKNVNHVLLGSETALLEGAPEAGLYEWSEGRLQLVSIDESGVPVRGEAGGAGGETNVRGAISNDGSQAFFCVHAEFATCGFEGALYMRDIATDESVRLDPETSTTREFQIADESGSRVFFTYAEGSQNEHLAACAFAKVGGKLVCDRSEVAREAVGSVLGINASGDLVYFVSEAVLAGGAVAGEDNLYAARMEGGKWEPSFIATLSQEDERDWGSFGTGHAEIDRMTARVSPDGRYLAFMSDRSLTGYDNRDAVSGEADQEVFLYDEQSHKLSCPSCNPTGARPHGMPYGSGAETPLVNNQGIWNGEWVAASVPGWVNISLRGAIHQTSYLSDEGRLFFNSSDAMVPQDSDGLVDVYEYEPTGVGSCTRSEGCVQLISSGSTGQESVFLDASANGDDVFFISPTQLTAQDDDTAYDVYDAHVCTAAVPCEQPSVAPPPCNNGEACKAAPAPQPAIFGAPASATFTGAGNPVPPPAAKVKPPTRAQQLAKALKACRKDKSKAKRSSCEKQARKKYGAKAKAKAKPHKAKSGKSKTHKGGK